MATSTTVTINPTEVERDPLPATDLDLPGWAKSALDFIQSAGDAGDSVSLNAEEETVTPAEMAEDVGISRASIQRRITAGDIKCTKIGSRYRIPIQEVERFRRSFIQEMATTLADDF